MCVLAAIVVALILVYTESGKGAEDPLPAYQSRLHSGAEEGVG